MGEKWKVKVGSHDALLGWRVGVSGYKGGCQGCKGGVLGM